MRVPTRKEEGLLAYLVLHLGSHSRETLANLYWGDVPEQQARASLRAALTALRSVLGRDALLSDREAVGLNPSAELWVDALAFRAQATRFLADAAADPAAFDPGLYGGELLEGHFDDWALAEREQLRLLYLDALVHQAGRLVALARYDEAIAAAQRALAVDEAEERAHRHLIYLYAITGNRPAALRQFEMCRRKLKEELDVEPAPETLAVLEALPVATAAAPGPAPTTPGPSPANLPVPLTSFVGRVRELAEISRLLSGEGSAAGRCRLVTLTGAGGSGKTRLAIRVARQMLPQWRHGAWWTDLSLVQDPDFLSQAILAALGAAPAAGQPPLQTLVAFLQERNLLLLLDNCEHLADACAHLVARVLAECPLVQVLATSREPLGVPGEQLWPVPTFAVPAAAVGLDPAELLAYDAVRLFVERASMHRPAFELTEVHVGQVAEICRRLDGIPLAIELAAARVRMMSLDDILARLQKRLRLLASGSALAPPRHQTLRASIDWSYNQLTPAEAFLLQRLAVFTGGCTLRAAEAICEGEGLPAGQVLDVLGRVVDRSLVVAEAGRYRLLETIREYALERLGDAGETEAVRDRHSEHYLDLLRQEERRLCSSDQKAALAEIAAEFANIRLALEWAIDRRQVASLRHIAFPLLYFCEIRGRYHEGESVFRDAAARLQRFEETDPQRERSRQIALLDMQTHHAYFDYRVSGPAQAYAEHHRCMERLRLLGDKTVLRYSLRYLGLIARMRGKYDEAEGCLKESLALSQEAGRSWDIALDNAYLGHLARWQGAPERAQGYCRQALELGSQLGDPRLLALCLTNLALLLSSLGQLVEAGELAEEARSLAAEMGDRHNLAASWTLLADIARLSGEPAREVALLARSVAIWQEMGDAPDLLSVHVHLARLALSMENLRDAEGHLRAAASIATRYGFDLVHIDIVPMWASLLSRQGDAERAMELVECIVRSPATSAFSEDLAGQLRAELAVQLTPDQIERIGLRARSQGPEEIVQQLLAGPAAE